MFNIAIALSLLPLVMWGTSDYLAAKLSRKMSPFEVNFVFALYSLVIPVVVCIIFGFPSVTVAIVAKYFLVSIAFTMAFLSMVKGFSKGATGLVAPIANAYAAVTLLASVLLFDANISQSQVLPIVIIISGVVIVSYHKSKSKSKSLVYSVVYGLSAMLFFGLGFAVLSTINDYKWYQNSMLLSLAGAVYAPILMLLFVKKHPLKKMIQASKNILGFIGALIGSVGVLGFFGSIEVSGNVVLTATVASAAPLFTAFLSYKFDKERLTSRQRIGTVVVGGGVIFLNIVG